jgi:hypothetical protein
MEQQRTPQYDPNKYDPNVIIQAANEKLAASDLSGGQMVFQSALLMWVDDARDMHWDDSLREAVATLWLAYAQFLARAKQFKSATEAYEQAVSCPVAKSVGRVWLEYARFANERGKKKTSQNVYVRAIAEVTDEQDQNLLWNDFLEMMQESNPSLTLSDLRQAVDQQQPEPADSSMPEPVSSNNMQPPAAKRPRTTDTPSPTVPAQESRTHVVTAETVQGQATALEESCAQLPPEVAAQWMLRDGTGTAQPPPPLFGPSPPKLSDPTAKDLLGMELALSLIKRILDASSGTLLLDVCRALWAMQGLKEKQASAAIDVVDQAMTKESEKLETSLNERLSAQTGNASLAQQICENERRRFQSQCQEQRQHVLNGVAWEFRTLLCVQQQVLTQLRIPGFDGPTVDSKALEFQAKICSYLHSAFYLRSRIGDEPHAKMLQTQVTRLEREMQDLHHTAAPPGRLSPHPGMGMQQPMSTYYQQQPNMMQQYQTQQLPPPPPPMMQSPPPNQYYYQ